MFTDNFEKLGFTNEQVTYHLTLMHDAGLFVGKYPVSYSENSFWIIERLTNAGHDFIDQASNDKIWSKAMELIKSVSNITIPVLQALMTDLTMKALGLK